MAAVPHRSTDAEGEDHRDERALGRFTVRKAVAIATGITSFVFLLAGGIVAHEARYATKDWEDSREKKMHILLNCGLSDLRLGQLDFQKRQLRDLLDQGKEMARNRLELDVVEERMRQLKVRMDRDRCDLL